ncbi:MAG: SET domain-containing protein-lysine N-methyltransferase [Polyangiales bacterium]
MASENSVVEWSLPSGYVASSVEPRESGVRGMGLFARRLIREGETIAAFGGTVIDRAGMLGLPPATIRYTLQIEEELFLVSDRPGPADFVNHSCQPNAGLKGQVVLVAMRSVSRDEEITYDYAMSDASAYDEFPCSCGSIRCRGLVSGSDWTRPELWKRYPGYFSPYVQERIDELRRLTKGAERRKGSL